MRCSSATEAGLGCRSGAPVRADEGDLIYKSLDGKLRVSGHRRADAGVEPRHFIRMERIYGNFTRDDGQRITMIVFLCRPKSKTVRLSEEHTESAWTPIESASRRICPEFREEIAIYKEFFTARGA